MSPETMREAVRQMALPIYRMAGVPDSLYDDMVSEGNWHMDPARVGGGAVANVGLHGLDLALWLGGAAPSEVVAFATSAGAPCERFLNVQARLANGCCCR